MKIVSIDIESTGVSLDTTNQILEICAVLFDTRDPNPPNYRDSPTFNVRINYEFLSGSPFALNMNKQLIEDLVIYQKYKPKYEHGLKDQTLIDLCKLYVEPEEVAELFQAWLDSNDIKGSVNMAGKNVGVFDIPFLNNTVPFWSEIVKWKRRTVDPSILYVDNETDEQMPNLEQCKERSGLFKDNVVSHKALEDAMDVALLIYDKLNVNHTKGTTIGLELVEVQPINLDLLKSKWNPLDHVYKNPVNAEAIDDKLLLDPNPDFFFSNKDPEA